MEKKLNTLKRPVLFELEFLRAMGIKLFLFPFTGSSKLQLTGYIFIYALLLLTTTQLFVTLCFTGFKDWFAIINIVPNLGVCVMTLIKYTKLRTHKKIYNKIFLHFWHDLWDIVSETSQSHGKVLKRYSFFTMFVNRFIFYYSLPLILVVDSFPYLVMMYENKILGKELKYLYPFDGWYPFDKIKWYWAAYMWESCMTVVVVCVYGFSNMIHAAYIIYICMELKIMGYCIEYVLCTENFNYLTRKEGSNRIHAIVLNQLKTIIDRYNFLAGISASLDNILGVAMLLNFSLGSVFICLTAFVFTVVNNFYQSVRYFSFFTSLLVEIFNQCIIGQILSDHSEQLTEAIYAADWPNASRKAKKVMLMFMMRTQKSFNLTANGYIVMNLNTFSTICSTSYQFFNLLRSVYQ